MESPRTVRPARPVAPYLGGKRQLAKTIIARIEAIPHRVYAEPFVGMGGVFLRRSQAAHSEVINDLNREVATLFRVLQRHYTAFLDMMRFQLTSRSEFERLSATDPETLTDLERAARFLYLQRTAFGGNPLGSFGVDPSRAARFDITRLGPLLEDVHERLAGVSIECLPFDAFIQRYDRPQTLFYLDPPYWGGEADYGKGLFERSDYERLSALLECLQGRFILSLNDVPPIRELFSWAKLEPVNVTYSIAGGHRSKRAGELLISRADG